MKGKIRGEKEGRLCRFKSRIEAVLMVCAVIFTTYVVLSSAWEATKEVGVSVGRFLPPLLVILSYGTGSPHNSPDAKAQGAVSLRVSAINLASVWEAEQL
jgi:hypothetical protein